MNVQFEVVDVANDAGGRERLLALGQRRLPLLARGKEFVWCVDLNAVAKFIGLKDTGRSMLPPEVLAERLLKIMRTAQSIVRKIPQDQLSSNAIHNRKRDLRLLSHHVFRIGEAWLEVAVDGTPFGRVSGYALAENEFTTTNDLVRYGENVTYRLEKWWKEVKERDHAAFFERSHDAYFGPATLHVLLERSTWHPAQHTRQLAAVLEGMGIELEERLSPADLAGLPVPERLWE